METLKYKIIKSKKQYNAYCNLLEEMLYTHNKTKALREEIELVTFLIEKWDNEHNTFEDLDPVQLLKSLMQQNEMKPVLLSAKLGVSKGLVSDILNYKKGMSKEIIRKLSETFKLSHEAFNRHYQLISSFNSNQTLAKTAPSSRRRIAV